MIIMLLVLTIKHKCDLAGAREAPGLRGAPLRARAGALYDNNDGNDNNDNDNNSMNN